MISVSAALIRIYRPVLLWFTAVLVLAEVCFVTVVSAITPVKFSMWVLVVGSAARYWLMVVVIMLIAVQLRQFVANGVTRREFVVGATPCALGGAVLLAAFMPVGHGLESAVLSLAGRQGAGYPSFSAWVGLAEFGRMLPGMLGFLVSGGLFAIVVLRYQPWIGIPLLLPAAAPLAVSAGLFDFDAYGIPVHAVVPYSLALPISAVVTVAGAAALWWAVRDVAIRRTSG